MDWADVMAARLDQDQLEGFVTVEEVAQQMGVTERTVRQLIRDRVLRSAHHGIAMLVQPAVINRC